MTGHAFLPPSGAAAWVACAMWPTMVQRFPETHQSPQAMEGNAAHWALEEVLHHRTIAEGQIAPNGHVLTVEMLEGADLASDFIRSKVGQRPNVEQHLTMHRVIHPQNEGTPDVWDYVPGAIHVFDYKFGHGVVDAFENWQLIDYAAGVVEKIQPATPLPVHLHVIQPRAFHRSGPVRTWITSTNALKIYWEKLVLAADDATSRIPTSTPGEQCVYCPGRHACEALQRDGYRSAQISSTSAPLEMPLSAAGLELAMLSDALGRLKSRVSGLESQVEAAMRNGETCQHWALEDTSGPRKWNVPEAQVLELGAAMGVPLAKPAAPVTPAQAIKAGIDAVIVDAFADRARGKQLARLTEKDARRVFG